MIDVKLPFWLGGVHLVGKLMPKDRKAPSIPGVLRSSLLNFVNRTLFHFFNSFFE